MLGWILKENSITEFSFWIIIFTCYLPTVPHYGTYFILHGINTGLPLRGRWKIQRFLRKSIWLSVYTKSWSYSLRGFQRLIQSENLKKILTSKTLLLNFTARNYFSNHGLKFSATKTYPKYMMCNSISFQLFLFVDLNLCSFVKNMYLKPCLSILLFFIYEPQQ